MNKHFFSIILMTALFAAVLTSCKDDDLPVFSVTFDSKGGTPIPTQIVRQGGKVEKPADPTRPANYFAGWTVADNETSSLWDFDNGTVASDMRLYARWTQNIYTVAVSSDENGTASANVALAVEGELIRLEATANSGYRFAEWQVIEGGIALLSTTDNPASFIMPDEAVEVKALFIPVKMASFKLWQTYCASPDGIHEWGDVDADYTVTRLPDLPMRSNFGYTDGVNLKFRNNAYLDRHFQYINNYTSYKSVGRSELNFRTSTHEFYYTNESIVYARSLSDNTSKTIQIAPTSFVYVYAEYNNDVIASTNWGEVIIYRANDNEWYRMPQVQPDIYVVTPGAEMQTVRSGKQMYSSINYQGRTLIGEFPSGRLFEFTGSVLQVSEISPPEELLVIPPEFQPILREAQALAIYGGDLFVGQTLDGLILRYDYKQKQWSRFTRLFDFPDEGANIRDYPDQSVNLNFYAQRINSLIPFEDGLFVATSNLGEWYDNIVPSPLLTEEQIRQYGAVYKIYRPGCRTTYFPR